MYIKIVIYASRKLTIFILKSQKIHFTKYMQKNKLFFSYKNLRVTLISPVKKQRAAFLKVMRGVEFYQKLIL